MIEGIREGHSFTNRATPFEVARPTTVFQAKYRVFRQPMWPIPMPEVEEHHVKRDQSRIGLDRQIYGLNAHTTI